VSNLRVQYDAYRSKLSGDASSFTTTSNVLVDINDIIAPSDRVKEIYESITSDDHGPTYGKGTFAEDAHDVRGFSYPENLKKTAKTFVDKNGKCYGQISDERDLSTENDNYADVASSVFQCPARRPVVTGI
jgi:hypothetical protein